MQRLPVFHQEFDAGISGCANGLAFLQRIAKFHNTTDALCINSKNGTCACNCSNGCEIGHGGLRLIDDGESLSCCLLLAY